MPGTPGNKPPTIKLPGTPVEATATIQKGKDGPVAEHKFVTGWLAPISDAPSVNVNVSVGRRVGLPNFSDVRYSVSLTLPTVCTNEAIDLAHEFGREWCFEKMQELHEKLMPGG